MVGKVVDLFAGCGGLSLGLELAGLEPVLVSELNQSAMSTYLRNRPHAPVQERKNQLGDILTVTQNPDAMESLAKRLRGEHGEVDLVVGGPPCQGYSGIGHRRTFDLDKRDIPSNHLYAEMATFISAVAPKAFIFENVRGLLSSRWTKDGEPGGVWKSVEAVLKSITTRVNGRELHYEFTHRVLYASDYGVPQNRPRVIGIGIRSDLVGQLGVPMTEWHPAATQDPPHPREVLGDLEDPHWQAGPTKVYPAEASTEIQRWLRADPATGRVRPRGHEVTEQEYSRHSVPVMQRFNKIRTTGHIPPDMQTKKFHQRAIPAEWDSRGPTITVASLPDDFVHYAFDRAPTVREWARLQTFPDWYQFDGPRTTGGRRRAGDPGAGDWSRDVPKFTQIGNAVPVRMGEALGNRLTELLGLGS